MSTLLGVLNVADSDRVYLNTLGQSIVYDAIQQVLTRINLDLALAEGLFVERTTSDRQLKYKLPGGGRMQEVDVAGGQPADVKATGEWSVGFPLRNYEDALGGNEIDMAYMTVGDLDRHLSTIFNRATNTSRHQIMKALFNSANETFGDRIWGDITVRRLANNDGSLYPPVIGSESELSGHSHYFGANYTAITDVNDPFPTIRDHLEEHFGTPTGGSDILAFVNQAQSASVLALTRFDDVPDRYTTPGANTPTPNTLPNIPGTARLLGRHETGVWVAEWRWMPAGYIYSQHLGVPAPLIRRVDLPETGIPTGLSMVAQIERYPITSAVWRHRFGYGVGNRLNGVMTQLVASTTYTTPAGY